MTSAHQPLLLTLASHPRCECHLQTVTLMEPAPRVIMATLVPVAQAIGAASLEVVSAALLQVIRIHLVRVAK
jgi:hypothetical protein